MEQIDPNDLLVFARVVAEGSLTAAADKLGLPKSTVSRRLSRLEELLGERLLLRTTRRLNITEFGAALLDHARQLESEVEAVAALAESRQARPSGRLRVSMPSDFANLLLTDMLAAFAALHPAVTLELDLSPRRVDLLGENFDLAIRLGDLPDDALLAARRLAVFPWGCMPRPPISPSTASRGRRTTSTAIARCACSRAPATRSAGTCDAASSAGKACRPARSPRTRRSC